MFRGLPKFLEFRLFAVLGSIALAVYLLNWLSGFISLFSDLIVIMILSWLLAFVLDPIVDRLVGKGVSRFLSVVVVYIFLAVTIVATFSFIIPATVSQLSTLAGYLPQIFNNFGWAGKFEGVVTSALSNSVYFAQTLASFVLSSLLIVVVSFSLLLSRNELESFALKLIPDKFEHDYQFLQKILNTTFASFLRAQVAIGAIVGVITTIVLMLFSIEFALSAGVLAGLLATIPVVGPIVSLIPPVLAAATISTQKGLISAVVLFLIYQLIYNIVAPKILGSALKIHPVFVILSFVIGYKIASFWGAVFAVPLAVSLGLIIKEFLYYWKGEADRT